MFASFKNGERRRGTAILRAEKPEGPFVPWSEGPGPEERDGRENNPPARKAGAGFPVTPPDWECLDGTFYADRQGNPWIVFCHEWVQAGDGEILAMPLTADLKAAVGEPRLLFRASEADWVTAPSFGGTGREDCSASGPPSRIPGIPRGWRFRTAERSTDNFPSLLLFSGRTGGMACFSGTGRDGRC